MGRQQQQPTQAEGATLPMVRVETARPLVQQQRATALVAVEVQPMALPVVLVALAL